MLQMTADSVPTLCHQGRQLSAGFCLLCIYLQPEVDQKEQNENRDHVLDVLDGNNIEKF